MVKKAIKRTIKKKKVNDGVRRRLIKNMNKRNEQKQSVNNSMRSSSTTPLPVTNQSSLRSQLIQRATTSFGFMPQQYGNINNERKIEDARNTNQTMTQLLNNEKVTLDAMNQERARLDSDIKALKKQKKDVKKKLEKATTDREMAEDEVNHAEEDERRTRRELARKNNAEQRLSEVTMKKNIIKYKTEADSLEATVHEKEMENQSLKSKYEENHAFHELNKKKADLQRLVNENTALAETINANEFINSNTEYTRTFKELEKEKYKNSLLKKKQQKEQELINEKISLASMPDDKYINDITNQYIEEYKAIDKEIINTKDRIQKAKEPIDIYEYNVQKVNEARKQLVDAQNEHYMIQAKQAKLNTQSIDNIQVNLKKQMENLGRQQANNDKVEMKVKNAHNILELKMDAERQKAYNAEISKGITEEEAQQFKEAGELEAKTNAQKQLNAATLGNRSAVFELAKAKANNDYYNSKEMHVLNDLITKTEIETINLQKQTENRDLLSKNQKHLQEASIAHQISSHIISDELSPVEQVDYIMTEELQPKLNDIKEKDALIQKLMELSNTHKVEWSQFLTINPNLANLLPDGNYVNMNTGELKKLVEMFDAFWKQTPEEIQKEIDDYNSKNGSNGNDV